MLPDSTGHSGSHRKFADHAVPELVGEMRGAGANSAQLEAALVGGAQMFASSSMGIGARNEAAVRRALGRHGIAVRAAATGGDRGRTLTVTIGEWIVWVREAGQSAKQLLGGGTA
jgi:chemotaxis protein CheD